jgi:nucleoside-diphosphate-sugar epimerase
MATVLVVGASGKTGLCLVEQLLANRHRVRVIVRSPEKFPSRVSEDPNLTVLEAAVLDLSDQLMADQVKNCDAVVSCLGHVMDFKGMFGEPKKLCTDATRRLCLAIGLNDPAEPIKFVLINTIGVGNPDHSEKRTWYERGLLTLLRYCLPPHRDNETAAEYLYRDVAKDNRHIEWCSVRPDSLIDAKVSPYEIQESPTTGIFTGRPTTRANVAHFMTRLIENTELWSTWRFKMPVIMNSLEAVESQEDE